MPNDKSKNKTRKQPRVSTQSENLIKLRKAEMLLDVSKTLAVFETLDEMLIKLVEISTSEVDADRGTIF